MTDQPEKFDLTSRDIIGDKIRELERIFPEIRTEGGKIDFERLKLVLGEAVDVGKERYGLNWPGKADCLQTLQQPSLATLRPCPEESVNFDTTENLIIEGDNLEVLKLLQKSYLGKVKMIYIDPPYNTGNDFIYPDNYAESLQTYLEYTGQVDAGGRKFGTNNDTDGRFHSKWLNMMYPRLYLAKNLLREDGVIFISIDDHENDNLKKLCNDIFGEENFVESIIWEKRSTPPNDKVLGANHDYVLVFAKNVDIMKLWLRQRSKVQVGRYKNPDNHPKGNWTPGDLMANVKGGRFVPSLNFAIKNPITNEEHYPGDGGNWRFNRAKIEQLIANNEIYFGADGKGRPKLKRFLADVKEGITWPTIWDFVPLNTQGSAEMTEIFGNMTIFENPKPSGLLVEICKLGSGPNDIILDFFAGSGSTAHAVLDLNKQDDGNRKFILVQLPEPCAPESTAFKAGFKTIADITKERVRRVINKLNEADAGKMALDGVKKQDRGFRVFKLAESNFLPWNAQGAKGVTELEKQLELHIAHILPDRTTADILYEILLKSGFPLTTPVQQITLAGKMVYSVADGALFICLEHELTLELIRSIAAKKPARVVCLDAGFAGNDQLKANAVQIFKNKGVTSFKTV
jgi:adenine-specific DNA-methyltransferase